MDLYQQRYIVDDIYAADLCNAHTSTILMAELKEQSPNYFKSVFLFNWGLLIYCIFIVLKF